MSDELEDDPELAKVANAPGARFTVLVNRRKEEEHRARERAEKAEKKRQQDEERERQRCKGSPRFEDLEDWTEQRLSTATFEPVRWLVQDLIPVGVWLCSAHPKIGKSLLMTALCRAVVTGTPFANYKLATKGPALYLDLEGKLRRAQSRQLKVRGPHEDGSPDFHTFFHFPTADQEGVAELRKAIVAWSLKLVVIDVWVGFRSQKHKGEDAYAYDYRSIQPLLELAAEFEITIILVHHNRKQADLDWMSETSGSTGLTGAVDGTISIKRQRGEDLATLSVSGRDVDEQELAMRFTDGLWTVLGDAKDFFAGENRKTIHGILSLPINRLGISLKDLIEDSGVNRRVVAKILKQMMHEAVVTCPKRGWYMLVNPL